MGDYHTVGDIAYRDDEGYLYICDRKKDMIIAGGVNIYPAEIEAALDQHPDIYDVAVFGIPSTSGVKPCTPHVVARPGLHADHRRSSRFARSHRELQDPPVDRLRRRAATHRIGKEPEARDLRTVLGRTRDARRIVSVEAHIDPLAERLFRAFEDNDADAVAVCCVRLWFSKNGVPTGLLQQVLPYFATIRDRIGQHRYHDVRRHTFADGFVEEHRVDAHPPGGDAITVYVCVVGRVNDDGLLTDLAEYVGAPIPNGQPACPSHRVHTKGTTHGPTSKR